jgi:hypothetical protein
MNDGKAKGNNFLAVFLLLAFLAAAYVAYAYKSQRDFYRAQLDLNDVEYRVPNTFEIIQK